MELKVGSLQVQRFRALRDVQIDGLGRVNLLTGRNNTGKSSLLEALRILAWEASPSVMHDILRFREEDVGSAELSRSVNAGCHGLSSCPGKPPMRWLVLLLLLATGCGPSTAVAIKGQVTFDGLPVDQGSITFVPTSEGKKLAAAIVGGQYEIPLDREAKPGTYRVEVSWSKKTGRTLPSADPGFTHEETREAIPAQYNTASTLTREIIAGENVVDFKLP